MEVEQDNNTIKFHLDHHEMLTGYKNYIKKSLRTKRVPIFPGFVLRPEDCPEVPDPTKQKYYWSFVAKLQSAASWISFDISFVVSQLEQFYDSAGTQQWSDSRLHHVMEYLEGFPSLNLTYLRRVEAI
jgi:hypothetical protein